jgi:hypothetical protein
VAELQVQIKRMAPLFNTGPIIGASTDSAAEDVDIRVKRKLQVQLADRTLQLISELLDSFESSDGPAQHKKTKTSLLSRKKIRKVSWNAMSALAAASAFIIPGVLLFTNLSRCMPTVVRRQ